jgi:hypothetical protein
MAEFATEPPNLESSRHPIANILVKDVFMLPTHPSNFAASKLLTVKVDEQVVVSWRSTLASTMLGRVCKLPLYYF